MNWFFKKDLKNQQTLVNLTKDYLDFQWNTQKKSTNSSQLNKRLPWFSMEYPKFWTKLTSRTPKSSKLDIVSAFWLKHKIFYKFISQKTRKTL